MAKSALTILDCLVALLLVAFAMREFLAIRIGTAPDLPRIGQVLGFDAAKVTFIFFALWGVKAMVKRIRDRFVTAQSPPAAS
jgi:hypothetical protein